MAGPMWVRLDVGYFTNPKILRAGTDGALLHMAAICYLGAHELDYGVLPAEAVGTLAESVRVRRPDVVIAVLVKHGLWHEHDRDWLIHDYDTTNGIRSEGYAARIRQRRRRDKQRRDRAGRFADEA